MPFRSDEVLLHVPLQVGAKVGKRAHACNQAVPQEGDQETGTDPPLRQLGCFGLEGVEDEVMFHAHERTVQHGRRQD